MAREKKKTTKAKDKDQEEVDGSSPHIMENHLSISFQLGPVKEVGVNGTTIERVLEVLAERLEGFQRGPFACQENGLALQAIREAIAQLDHRTMLRNLQNVEGENKPHES